MNSLQPPDTEIALPFASPLPASRPRNSKDSSEHDALQTATHAECLASAQLDGIKPVKSSARVSVTKKSNEQRKALSKMRQEEQAAAAHVWRLKYLDVLGGFLSDIRTLPSLIIFPVDPEAATDSATAAQATPLSKAQTQRALNQVRALHSFYMIVEAYHPNLKVLECADLAAECTGVATGRTIYLWHLEVSPGHTPRTTAH